MEEFKQKFKEEATDLINELEEALLLLDNDRSNLNLIEQVFRVMHSLKGGGAMFGFSRISEFTHHLETIYDLVRNKKMVVTKELLSVTLNSVDHLKLLLEDENDDILRNHNQQLAIIQKIIQTKDDQQLTVESNGHTTHPRVETNTPYKTYLINFEPHGAILLNGTNPIFLIDELNLMGKSQVWVQNQDIPSIHHLDCGICYVSWQLLLYTSHDENAIRDVFIFVEDECVLKIELVADIDVFAINKFRPQLLNLVKKVKKIEKYHIQQLLQTNNDSVTINEPIIIKAQESTIPSTKKHLNKENIISSIRVDSDKLDRLMNMVSELVTTQASLNLLAEENDLPGLMTVAETMENLTRQLRDLTFNMSLIPIDTVVTRFQRLVRDLSSEFGKDIAFVAEGTETELDKNIIQSLTEPIMHIIRNSIDHGIETPQERLAAGKPEQGKIVFKAFYSGAYVYIQISDDGKGINLTKIYSKAVDMKLITGDEKLNQSQLIDLVFMPGVSTAQVITGISGRGVGMDVVKKRVADIRGEIELDTVVGVGTSITIKLPLTLSIIDGLLVKIDKTLFIIPLSVVDKIYAAESKNIKNSFNSIIVFDGEQVPYYDLSEEFKLAAHTPEIVEIVVVRYLEKRIGLVVDSVIGEVQAVLKPLGKMYSDIEMFSGATVLGDGTVALVMDTNKIIKQLSEQFTF